MGKVTRQCPQTTTFLKRGEPKRYRTEVLPLTSLTPYRKAKPAHSDAGIKMEGLLYLQNYGISGPEFGIKEEFVTEKGRQLFHACAINREACCLQLGQLTGANWNHTLVSGFTWERRLLHPMTALRPSTNELLTELKTFSSFQLQNLQRQFHQQSD